jgi:hypothetical protein
MMCRTFFKWLFNNCYVAKIINNHIVQIGLPVITGTYITLVEIDFEFLRQFPHAKENLLLLLLALTLIVSFYGAIAKALVSKSDENYKQFLENFMVAISKVVTTKLDRFKRKAPHLPKTGNIFKEITQPKAQIEQIHKEAVSLLMSTFQLKDDEVCITIMHIDDAEDKQYFAFNTQPVWIHTKAKKLLSNKSSAAICLERGESVFHPSKKKAAKCGEYILTERDERKGDGSIFCFPVVTECADYIDRYVISIVSYGKRVCEPGDNSAEAIARIFFTEICKRLDIELTLNSIKSWQESNSRRVK